MRFVSVVPHNTMTETPSFYTAYITTEFIETDPEQTVGFSKVVFP